METPTSMITSTGDLGGQKVKMSFDENSLAHLMSVLTDLYSDPQLAVIREYSTNALDAHIAAGNPDPIEVITPNALSPYFIVRDKGIGLSVADITDMYSKYGASTKRGTNDQVGMLGLGAKSALTLVSQFNLTSVHDGVKIFVSVSRSSDGSGQMEIIDTVGTEEPNGVEIKIPVPRNTTFAQKCVDFFRFWKPGTVLVDGKEPSRIDGRWVDENTVINKNLNQDYIVMGNVAYPAKEGLYSERSYGYNSYRHMGIVAFVNIGDVNFTPSREQLHYTAKTKQTIELIRANVAAKIAASARKDVAESDSYLDAWKKALDWNALFYNSITDMTYKKEKVPTTVRIIPEAELNPADPKDRKAQYYKTFSFSNNARYRGYQNQFRDVSPKEATKLYVYGFAASMKMSPVQREKARIYCEQNKINATEVAIHDGNGPTPSNWLDGFTFVPWSDIAPIKVERQPTVNGVARTEPYDLIKDGSNYSTTQVSAFDKNKKLTYYSPSEMDGNSAPTFLRTIWPDIQIVKLSMNRWDKFKRLHPEGVHWQTLLREYHKEILSKFTDEDKIYYHYNQYSYSVSHIDPSKVDDSELAKFVRAVTSKAKHPLIESLQAAYFRGAPQERPEKPENPLTRYPLSGSIKGVDAEHMYWYLNSYYNDFILKEN